jgi:hypothetical protein
VKFDATYGYEFGAQALWALFSLRDSKEINQISVWVTEVNRTSTPWLGRRGLDPGLHQTLQSQIFLIDVVDPEFQNYTLVAPCFG